MEMKLVAPPYYEITTVTTSKSNGITLLNQVLKLVEEKAKISQDFQFKTHIAPNAVGGDNNQEDIETI